MNSEISDEWCSYCETEQEIPGDMIAACPNCGKPVFPCNRCMGSEDNEDQHCDWSMETKTCWRFREPFIGTFAVNRTFNGTFAMNTEQDYKMDWGVFA